MREGVAWPRVYGGGVEVETGEVFTAKFSYHGPDPDIRALRLHSKNKSLVNIYDSYSGKILLKPFSYQSWTDAHLWLQRTDEFILRYCSTSPKVEPPSFCDNMRANFRVVSRHTRVRLGLDQIYGTIINIIRRPDVWCQ